MTRKHIEFVHNNKTYTVFNLHGLWTSGGKTDTPSRIEQSEKVKAFVDKAEGGKILCGDFNLLPHTRSIEILESNLRNLIKEYGVTSTRSELYTKPERFADYTMVSKEINVHNFKVMPEVVSDHIPLLLDFS